MKKPATIPLAIICLAVPALFFAWAAAAFVKSESARVAALVADADRAAVEGSAAVRLKEAVKSAKAQAEAALQKLPADPSAADVAALADDSLWIRNAFLWRRRAGVVFPAEKGATHEERRFLARYVTLFDEGFGETPPSAAAQMPARARRRTASAASPVQWRAWYEGERLSFIGWRWLPDGAVAGVELETVAFLAEFPSILASAAPEGLVLAVKGGDGRVDFMSASVPEGRDPDSTVSLAPELPHAEIAVWRVVPAAGGSHVVLFAASIAAALLGLLAAGGWLLVREARREKRDSARKTSFVSNVSHELKTPLASIRLYAEMLSEGRVADEGKRRRYLDVIVKECGRLTRLVNNVLDFGRLEQRRRKFDLADVDLRAAAREAAESQRSRAEAAGMRLAVALPADAVVRRVDFDAVSQVVVNLVDNAVKYAADGGALDVSVGEDGRITVSDRGRGIAAKHRERIFERFYRCDDSLTAAASGSGLGLAIARGLVRGMGGELSFRPRPGGGSEFVVDFGGKT